MDFYVCILVQWTAPLYRVTPHAEHRGVLSGPRRGAVRGKTLFLPPTPYDAYRFKGRRRKRATRATYKDLSGRKKKVASP